MNKFIIHNYLPYINPFATEEDLEEVRELNEYEILFVFKNGDKIILDKIKHNWKRTYESDYELTEEDCKRHFSSQLRCWMNRKNVGQDELAKKIGATQPMISRYVSGRVLPNYYIVYKIAKALDCSIDDLFYKEY